MFAPNVDNPAGDAVAYERKAKQLETRIKNNMDALGESLGLEVRKVEEGAEFGP
jgi:hypothetical protein